MLAWKSVLRFWNRALKVPFSGTWKCQKCPFSSARKWDFECPNRSMPEKSSKRFAEKMSFTFPSVFLNLPLPLFIIPHVSLDGHRSLSLIKHSCFEEMENSFYFPLCPNHLVQIVTFCSDCFHCFSINLLLPSLIWIILNYPSVSQRHSHNRQKVNNWQ